VRSGPVAQARPLRGASGFVSQITLIYIESFESISSMNENAGIKNAAQPRRAERQVFGGKQAPNT
ncbi:MAG: hypothetical protein AAF645_12590, partial [Myxococcota bacterium]